MIGNSNLPAYAALPLTDNTHAAAAQQPSMLIHHLHTLIAYDSSSDKETTS